MLIKNIVQSHVKDKDFVHLDSEGRPLGVKLYNFDFQCPFLINPVTCI